MSTQEKNWVWLKFPLDISQDDLPLLDTVRAKTQPFFSQCWTRPLLLLGASDDIADLHLGEMRKHVWSHSPYVGVITLQKVATG